MKENLDFKYYCPNMIVHKYSHLRKPQIKSGPHPLPIKALLLKDPWPLVFRAVFKHLPCRVLGSQILFQVLVLRPFTEINLASTKPHEEEIKLTIHLSQLLRHEGGKLLKEGGAKKWLENVCGPKIMRKKKILTTLDVEWNQSGQNSLQYLHNK